MVHYQDGSHDGQPGNDFNRNSFCLCVISMCKINPSIIIVDDSLVAANLISAMVLNRHPNAKVVMAASYVDAQKTIARTKNIALVVLDNDLGPGRTGSDLANELRSQGRKFGIIVVSGSDVKIDRHFKYIDKPIDTREFYDAVASQIAFFSIRKDAKSIHENVNHILKAKEISDGKVYGYV